MAEVLSEFDLIDQLRQRATQAPGLLLGIGDDCSVQELAPETDLLTSVDLLLEGVHFRHDWTTARDLGYKAIAVNLSDLAAMGASPLSIHLGLALPQGFDPQMVADFNTGVFDCLETHRLPLAGGDTSRSRSGWCISVTVQGVAPRGQRIERSGAQVGDDLWVSGTLGDSALALHNLQQGRPLSPALAQRHFRPQPRLALGQALAAEGLASAMLDLSDGLSGDLGHLCQASGVGALLQSRSLPQSPEFSAAVAKNPELLQLAFRGGEDYELLFAARPAARQRIHQLSASLQIPLSRIGQLQRRREILLEQADGTSEAFNPIGYDHFCRQEQA